jgi:hypothetical protein
MFVSLLESLDEILLVFLELIEKLLTAALEVGYAGKRELGSLTKHLRRLVSMIAYRLVGLAENLRSVFL